MLKKLLGVVVCILGVGLSAFGQDLPSVKVKTLDGKVVDTSSFLSEKKPVIISFFGTWCKPCLRELDAIHEVYDEWQKETGVTLYAICINEGSDVFKAKPVAHAHGWEFPVLLDTNLDLKRSLNVELVPTMFIFNGKGKIVHRTTGYVDGGESEVLKVLRELKSNEK